MRRLFGGVLAALVLGMLLAVPAAAAEPSELRYFERGRLAYATGESCRESADGRRATCTYTDVNVFKGRRGSTEPEFRFRGEEVCMYRATHTFNIRTGRTISDSYEEGCATNRASLDVDFGRRLRWATVDGTMRLHRERCDEQSCESDTRRVSIDLTWDGHGPVTDRFIYYRETRANCESTFTGTERSRAANVTGHIGNKSVRMDGHLVNRDFQETRVCQ